MHLEWEDNDLAFVGRLDSGVAICLKAGERRERDLLFTWILRTAHEKKKSARLLPDEHRVFIVTEHSTATCTNQSA